MSPEQFLLLVLAFSSSTLSLLFSLLLLLPSRRSRNRRDPFLDCRDHCSAKGPTTPKPQFPPGRRNPFVSDFQQQINDALDLERIANPPPRKP